MTTDSDLLLRREKLLRDSFTPAEVALFMMMIVTCAVTFWWGVPRSPWLLGFFLTLGCITPFILNLHQQTHPFFVDRLWSRFGLLTLPVWFLTLQFIIGLFNDPLVASSTEDSAVILLRDVNVWLPVTTGAETTWLPLAGYTGATLIAVNLLLVPKSRAFFQRLMPWLCLVAVGVGVFGFIQAAFGASKPFLTEGTGRTDFFAYFPYDGHWAAFAILWTCACFGMALLSTRYEDSPSFIQSNGPFYLAGGMILGGSAFLIEAKWPSILLITVTALMLLLVARQFSGKPKDPHRTPIIGLSGILATIGFATALVKAFQSDGDRVPGPFPLLRESAINLFAERPLFGWGLDSFNQLLPFYGSDLLQGRFYESAGSDFLQFPAELGLLVPILSIGLLLGLFVRYALRGPTVILTNHLLCGCLFIAVLSAIDSPLMSPTVFFSFLVLFFTAVRWADLTRSRVDEVDAPRPVLVTPAIKRRIPFFNPTSTERFK